MWGQPRKRVTLSKKNRKRKRKQNGRIHWYYLESLLIFKIRLKLPFFFIPSLCHSIPFLCNQLGQGIWGAFILQTVWWKTSLPDICLPLPSHRQPRNGTPFWGPVLLENLATPLHSGPCVAYTIIFRWLPVNKVVILKTLNI